MSITAYSKVESKQTHPTSSDQTFKSCRYVLPEFTLHN